MMTISLSDAGKRFNREWIFRHLNRQFQSGTSYAIIGPNGSGKSTLLQVIAGAVHLSEGKLSYERAGLPLDPDSFFKEVSVCAPYLELMEEMTLAEFLSFHSSFKKWLPGLDAGQVMEQIGLGQARNKQIRFFSSGMKQRVRLAQCIFANTAVLFLDEPCTNLDREGISLYHRLINDYCRDRLVLVASNDETEWSWCDEKLSLGQFAN